MPIDRRGFLKSVAAIPLTSLAASAAIPSGWGPRGKKILIIGGTHFLGPHIVKAAVARGHTVTLFNRGRTNPHLFPELEKLKGDRNKEADLAVLDGRKFDAVIDDCGFYPRQVRSMAARLENSGFYVFISSVSVYPRMDSEDTDETTPVGKIDDETVEDMGKGYENYGPLKALCEQAAEAAFPGRVANIRPGLIVGPLDDTHRFTYWPVRVRDGGEVLAPGKPEWGIQYIDVRDLADYVVLSVEKSIAGVYNALGPVKPTPMQSLLETSKQVTKSDATFTWVDQEFLAEQKVMPWAHLPAWFPPGEGKTRPAICSNERAVSKGLAFRDLSVTIRDLLEWYAKEVPPESAPASAPSSRPRRPRFPLSREREREVLAAWHESRKKK
jgi:2'-hydroxyisoflavone reductase